MDWIEINELSTFSDTRTYWFRLQDLEDEDGPESTVKGTFQQYPWATHYATIEVVY